MTEPPHERTRPIRLHQQLDRDLAHRAGLQRLSAVNHTIIGRRFIITAFVFFGIGGVLAMLIRAQLATPRSALHRTRRPTTRSSPCTAR